MASSRPPSTFSGPSQTTKELEKTSDLPAPSSRKRSACLALKDGPENKVQFNPKFTTVGSLTIDMFLVKLTVMEPEHFGGKSLEALIPRGKRAHNRVELNHVFTFCCGREPHYAIDGDEVSEDVFDRNIAEEASLRGHRGRGLPLGNIDWERDGICTWHRNKGTIVHRFTNEEYKLTKDDLEGGEGREAS